MIQLRTTFIKDGEIQCYKDSQHATYRAAKEHWLADVDCFGHDHTLFGAFWRGRWILSFKVS